VTGVWNRCGPCVVSHCLGVLIHSLVLCCLTLTVHRFCACHSGVVGDVKGVSCGGAV